MNSRITGDILRKTEVSLFVKLVIVCLFFNGM